MSKRAIWNLGDVGTTRGWWKGVVVSSHACMIFMRVLDVMAVDFHGHPARWKRTQGRVPLDVILHAVDDAFRCAYADSGAKLNNMCWLYMNTRVRTLEQTALRILHFIRRTNRTPSV